YDVELTPISYTIFTMVSIFFSVAFNYTTNQKEMAMELVTSFVNEIKNLGFNTDEIIEIVKESLEREVK
ncbi:hypothetical protein SAMN04324257_02908, partial [Thermoanaerobacter thermohydrosulfuricus]